MEGTPTCRASRICSRGLRHGSVSRRHHQDGAVHLCRTRDHVLDVVRVSGAIHVGVMPLVRLVLDVRDIDGDSPLPLFRCLVDLVERHEISASLFRQHLRDGRRQRRLAVIDMADGADVEMWFRALEFCLAHLLLLWNSRRMIQSLTNRQSPGAGLNRRPRPYQGRALPTELPGHGSRDGRRPPPAVHAKRATTSHGH